MQPPDRHVWRRVPGYDSDDEGSEDSEDARLAPVVQERLGQLSALLSERVATSGPGPPLFEFTPAPMPATASRDAKAAFGNPPLYSHIPHLYSQALGFRIEHTDAPVVRDTLVSNGMCPTPDNWLILWSGPRMHESVYQDLGEHQRVNHFPSSTELTRKDKLWLHFHNMAQIFGSTAFDFVPETYVLPDQLEDFIQCYEKTNTLWIVKPNASSRGRGIFLLRSLDELPVDEVSVVSRYVHNPLLIQGLKFDLRVYVLVTSYDPLRAYVYREGLTRFACVPYSTEEEHLQDAHRHLTNYSINKESSEFVENKELEADNVGHKWSLSALNKHLKCVGVDVELMWARIMDLIVKSLLSVEPVIAARTRHIAPHPTNCFELYGFDVLVDAELKPWLLEVNLSPSMQADSPLDWQIKSSLLSDALNLVGIHRVDRQTMMRQRLESRMFHARRQAAAGHRRPPSSTGRGLRRSCDAPPQGAGLADAFTTVPSAGGGERQQRLVLDSFTEEELRSLAQALQEHGRCHNFIRLYPTCTTVLRYEQILDGRVHSRLRQARRTSRSSHLLAALLFGPPPVRLTPAGGPLPVKSVSAPSLLQPLPTPMDALDADRPSSAASLPGAVSQGAKAPLSFGGAGGGPTPRSGPDAVVSDGLGSVRRALEAVKEIGVRDGCRVVLMEYLLRIADACGTLGTAETARLPQAACSRLGAFQKRLNRGIGVVSAAKPPSQREREHSGEPAADDRALLEELAAACKACLSCLERDAAQPPPPGGTAAPAVGAHPARAPGAAGALPERRRAPALAGGDATQDAASPEDGGSALARRLPPALSHSAAGQRLLAVLPRLSALDLERILADPRSDSEFRSLIDASAERSGETIFRGHFGSFARAVRRRGMGRPVNGRPIESRRMLAGPLSELLQGKAGRSSYSSGQAAAPRSRPPQIAALAAPCPGAVLEGSSGGGGGSPASAAPSPGAEELRRRRRRAWPEQDMALTPVEQLMGRWARTHGVEDSWQRLQKPVSHQALVRGLPGEEAMGKDLARLSLTTWRHQSGSSGSVTQGTGFTSPVLSVGSAAWRDIEL